MRAYYGLGAFKLSTSGGHRVQISKIISREIAKGQLRSMFSGDRFFLSGPSHMSQQKSTWIHWKHQGKQHGAPEPCSMNRCVGSEGERNGLDTEWYRCVWGAVGVALGLNEACGRIDWSEVSDTLFGMLPRHL